MGQTALAYDAPAWRAPVRQGRRRSRARAIVRTLDAVPLAAVAATSAQPAGRRGSFIWLLALVAIALHAWLVWEISHLPDPTPAKRISQLAVELVTPPKPPEPKIEPPKPEPPKVKHEVPPQVLPPIQTAPSNPVVTAVPSVEPPVAVAPIVSEAPPAPEPVTEAVGFAGYLNNPPPEYPPAALRNGWQGTVVLRVRVLSSGQVESIEVKDSSGKRLLDEQAARTVKNWTFTPSKRGNTPIDGWATVPIEFKLDT